MRIVSRSQTATSPPFFMLTSSVGEVRVRVTSASKNGGEAAVWLREKCAEGCHDMNFTLLA